MTQRRTKGASGRAARSLSFERCEQRLALSTNTGYEPVHVHLQGLDGAEGGFIVLTSGVGFTASMWEGGIVRAFSSGNGAADHWTWLNANDSSSSYSFNSGAAQIVAGMGLNDYFSPRLLGANGNFQTNSGLNGSFDSFGDLDFGAPGVLVTESNVVPISPPASEHGGNEGGQISMIPFIGPSMFGLPTANESQLAVRTRQALSEEQLESTPAAGSPEVNSLRGRAVVYEVAHAEAPFTPSRDAPEFDVGEFGDAGRDDRAFDSFASADFSRGSVDHLVAVHHVSIERHEERHSVDATEQAAEAAFARAPLDDGRPDQGHQADAESSDRSAKTGAAAAHDAAFDRLEREMGPLEEQREVAAATADVNHRRLVGGALLAVASVPILKMRRRGRQQAVELRPRRPFQTS